MRYIKETPFVDRKGTQVILPLNLPALNGKEPTREPTIGRILHLFLDSYEPSTELRISPSDMKNKVWPALDVLEKGPNEKGYYVFENSAFEILDKVARSYAERAQGLGIARHSPIIVAALDSAGVGNDPTALEPPSSAIV